MTDFDLLRQLRDLNTPRPPQTDLWPAIAARIAAAEAADCSAETASPLARLTPHKPRPRSTWLPLAAAASLLLAVAGTLHLGLQQPAERMANHAAVSPLSPQTLAAAPGGDPRLASAAIVLDSAHAELEQALDQNPDATFLVGLLARTNARRVKLDHYGAYAG